MLERLEALVDRYEQLSEQLCDPATAEDPSKLRIYSQEQSALQEAYDTFLEYKSVREGIDEAKAMQEEKLDAEMAGMVKAEILELEAKRVELEERLHFLLLPKDPNDDKNVIVEIRGAVGGDEAALFAANLYKMYTRYAESRGWKTHVMHTSYNDIGGFKEVVFSINGKGAFSRLKFESGAHRVQRVPETESGGRIHTSTATVAVLPEVEDLEVEIHDKDIRVDTFCSSGPGGQSVNTTQSAVRVTHLPTGISVSCQDGKSQNSNKDQALKVLRARIWDKARQEEEARLSSERKSKVGTGDRSERIRTYNYPQNRVTDHRIGLSLHKLEQILNGDLNEVIDALVIEEQAERMERDEAISR